MIARQAETPGVESWTPPDGAERLTAALGGKVLPPRREPPVHRAQPTGLEPLIGLLERGDRVEVVVAEGDDGGQAG